MNQIDKLLEKRGIKDVTQLSQDERDTFDRWEKILSDGKITAEKIRAFCEAQVSIIERKWRDLDNSPEKNQRLITMHTVYKTLMDAIDKPSKERENLENYLQQLIQM